MNKYFKEIASKNTINMYKLSKMTTITILVILF